MNNRFIQSVLVATLSLFGTASAQLLWKVSGNGLSKPSYLFGTCHVATVKMTDSIPGFNDALANCDAVYGEIEKADIANAQQAMMAAIMAPADSTLSKVIDPATLAKTDSLFRAATQGMVSISQLETLKPAYVSTQLALIMLMESFPGFNPMEQIDFAIQGKATQLGKELGGFETTEFQLNLLYGKPIKEQAESLSRTLAKLDSAKAAGIELANAYKAQDLNAVYEAIMKEQCESDEPEWKKQRNMDELIYNRNAVWAKKLQELMPTKSILVVVGAGHLPGEKGLIDLLQKAGYSVQPVK
ncbi:MAG: TraB/GumN family protein [Muribaculaceae bacterium]